MLWLTELRTRLREALSGLVASPDPYVEMLKPAQDPKFGDFQANCAMSLAKQLGQPPRTVAQQIVERLRIDDLCDPPEIAGPGFINLRLKTDRLAAAATVMLNDDRLGVPTVDEKKTVVVDYSSPNVAKPMHVGHLRSTVIGQAIDRILRYLGYRVISDNHVGDWGTQFGMILYGYKHFLNAEAFAARPVAELSRLYRLVNQLSDYHEQRSGLPALHQQLTTAESALTAFETAPPTSGSDPATAEKDRQRLRKKHQQEVQAAREAVAGAQQKCDRVEADPALKSLAEAHPQIAERARRETALLHAGDPENLALWNQFLPACLNDLQTLYQRFGLRFDLTLGESHYNPMLPSVVNELQQRGLATESEGAICVFQPGFEAPFLVRKADGAFTYATTDLATIRYRVETLHADTILYVVDARQSEHFQQLFATARQWGYSHVDYRHVSFGTILGEDRRPFKTRSGDTIGLESLLDEGVARARQIVDENDDGKPVPELSPEQRAAVAEKIGIGGIIYADLRHNRDSDYVFQYDKMLAKTGDTATYIQYAYARVRGIFLKENLDAASLRTPATHIQLVEPAERQLALQLQRFGEAVKDVVQDYRPNLLTQYLFETANAFAMFYEACPVLKEPQLSIRQSRLALCDLTARVLAQGLELLGIGVAEKM
jgi:arginyl-tRNA synthetase